MMMVFLRTVNSVKIENEVQFQGNVYLITSNAIGGSFSMQR